MKQILVILSLVNVVHYAERQLLAVFAPEIMREYTLDYFDMAQLICGFMAGYVFSGPLMTYLNGRQNPYKLILANLIIGATSMLIMASFGAYFYVFLAMRVMLGFAVGSFNTLAPPLILEKNTRLQTANVQLGVYYMMVPLGLGLAFLVGTFSISFAPWKLYFGIGGGISMFLAVSYALYYPRHYHRVASTDVSTKKALGLLWRDSTYRNMSLGFFFYIGAGWGFLSWATTFGIHHLGMSAAQANLGLALCTICAAAVGTYIGSRFGSLFNTNQTQISGFCYFGATCLGLSIPFSIILTLTIRPDYFFFSTFMMEVLMFAAHAPIMTSLLASAPLGLAPLAAGIIVFFVHGFGDLLFVLMIGYLADANSWQVAFYPIPAGLTLAALLWYGVGRKSFRAGVTGQSPFAITPFAEGCARLFQVFLWMGAKLYFKEIYVYKKESEDSAADTPTLYIANHPNGLVDILVLYVTVRKTLRFVAKNTLWENPVLRPLLALGGCIPIYRKQDDGLEKPDHGVTALIQDNNLAMQTVSEALSFHSFAIYPEGISHNAPNLSKFKTGGSRMLLNAASLGSSTAKKNELREQLATLTISHFISTPRYELGDYGFQPVGMYFDDKTEFRSRALIHYGPRIRLADIFSAEELKHIKTEPENPAFVKKLTDNMHIHISKLIPLSETENERNMAQQTAALMLDPGQPSSIKDFFGWDHTVQNFINILKAKNHDLYIQMRAKIENYFDQIQKINTPDVIISSYQQAPRPILSMFLNQIFYWLFTLCLSPFIMLGIVLYSPCFMIAEWSAAKMADGSSEVSTYKFLAGGIFGIAATVMYLGVIVSMGWWRSAALMYFISGMLVLITSGIASIIFAENWQDRWAELRALTSRRRREDIAALAAQRRLISGDLANLYSYAKDLV